MENTDLETKLTELDNQRTLLVNDKNVMKGFREEFEKMHNDLILKIRQDAEDVSESETEIRRLALEDFAKNGSKDVGFGVGIRVMNKIEYDYETALAWGMEHRLALKVDDAAIKKLAALQDTTKNLKLQYLFWGIITYTK